ncbi:threonine-phosphate decarboxylase [Lichenicoccus roseus]|uniref:threonine-phosphate decarboxylase n=2 Tax=Lichenicoccus roseus TaxID=2683649 RepID=A0A5R9J8W3_9PROT|nr:threonine-phosphate decarboxylase [Lichenicoccus roseus]
MPAPAIAAGIAHGGRLIEARRRFPSAPQPFLDLSTGINPHPYPLAPIDPARLARLPEPEELSRLQAVAARAYGVADPDMVVATPGTQIAISLLPHLLGCSRAVILSPTYAEHAAAWRHAGRPVEAAAGLEAFERGAMLPGTAAVLCNPNNPDGARSDRVRLLALAAGLARQGGVLICDEAFLDLEPDMASLGTALPHPGLLVLRSFGKTYGLAGIRLGFVLASPGLAGRLRSAFGPWAIGGLAIEAGCAALADEAWRAGMAERLLGDGAELDRLLLRYGWRSRGGTALFRLYQVRQATRLYAHLGEAGVLVRRFEHQPDLLRLGLPGDSGGWARLEGALATAALS